MTAFPVHLSRRCHDGATQPISYFMVEAVENPGLITLAAGLVDPGSLPATEAAEALRALLEQPGSAQAALQYGTTQGYAALREKLLERTCAMDTLTAQQMSLTPHEVVITTGSQQLLYLLTEILCDPGDLVIAETPTYFVYLGLLQAQGVRVLGVGMDEEGMNIDALEELLRRLDRTGEIERLRLIYTCDYFQNPSGLTLSLPRRLRLLELARRYSRKRRLLIIEDAAYRELRYEGEDIPSIKSLDEDNSQVILAMSFSKTLAPGLKTGYGIVPKDLLGPLVGLKGSHDFGSNNLAQHLLDRLLASGAYDRHVERMRSIYLHKRDVLLEALSRQFGRWPLVRWTHPRGGMYVWLTFPPGLDAGPDGPLLRAAIREGVLYVPGIFCCPPEDENRGEHAGDARLCFGPVPAEQLGEAMARLARAAAPLLEGG